MAEFDPVQILTVLTDHQVDLIIIGGVAARLRGAPLLTQDVDVTPATGRANLERLAKALQVLDAKLRTASDPGGISFPFDPHLLESSNVWTLTTAHGDLDLVFEPAGTSGYRDLARDAEDIRVSINPLLVVKVASLADVIRSKQSSGRDKDRAALPMLRRTLEETTSKRQRS